MLASTIKAGKNLRSIVNKILMQFQAKMSAIPWAVSDLPFTNEPTMVIGYDVFHQSRKQSRLAFVATIN